MSLNIFSMIGINICLTKICFGVQNSYVLGPGQLSLKFVTKATPTMSHRIGVTHTWNF